MTIQKALDAIARHGRLLYEDLRTASSPAPDCTRLLPEQLKPYNAIKGQSCPTGSQAAVAGRPCLNRVANDARPKSQGHQTITASRALAVMVYQSPQVATSNPAEGSPRETPAIGL